MSRLDELLRHADVIEPSTGPEPPFARMEHSKECIARVEACRDLAAKAKGSLRRAELLELAITWKLLAEQHESLLQSRQRLAEMT